MAKVKYILETVYIAEPEQWDELRNASSYIAQEMYADLLFVNSGALMLHQNVVSLLFGVRNKRVTFLYPEVDVNKVRSKLYSLLRKGSSEDGISFNGTFRFSVVNVKGAEVELTEDLIGLEIRFIK